MDKRGELYFSRTAETRRGGGVCESTTRDLHVYIGIRSLWWVDIPPMAAGNTRTAY